MKMENVDLDALLAEQAVMVEEMEKVKKEFQEKGKEILKKSFKSFFEAVPAVKAITWTQYTPYFNDGEACVFGVGDMRALSKKSYKAWKGDGGGYAEEFAVASSWGSYKDEENKDLTKEEYEATQKFIKNISKLSDDIFEDMFGDHVEVTATKKGFEVEEYNHD